MGHTCSDCGEEFATLSKLRLHDCPEDVDAFSVRVRARLITNESERYDEIRDTAGLNRDQPVFPDFDLAVEPGKPVPPPEIQQVVSNALDDIFREEHDLWGWAGTVSKESVRNAHPEKRGVTAFEQVGTIEVTENGDIVDTFVTLDELKSKIPSA